MSLQDELQSIQGIGPSKSEEIMNLIEEHQGVGGESALLGKAREYAAMGEYRRAGVFLRRDMDDGE